jgi:hypothetical protein
MIHPGLAALVGAHRIRSRISGTPDCDTGFRDSTSLLALWRGRRRSEALELDRHKRVLADGGEDDYAETWGLLSMPAAMRGRMEFRSMRVVRNPGKKAGSPRTSMWDWQALKTNPSKPGYSGRCIADADREDPCARSLCDLLHLETARQ